MRLILVAGFALLALASAPESLVAQVVDFRPIAPSHQALDAAERLRLPSGQDFRSERLSGDLLMRESRGKRRQGEILMIVGAAGIVTGLLVDEALVTIAGAAVGGFGLYLYLQATR